MAVIVNCHMYLTKTPELDAEIAAVIAATLKEDGCISYVFTQDQNDATHFIMVEEWASRAALDAHLQTPHFNRLNTFITAHVLRPAALRLLHAAH